MRSIRVMAVAALMLGACGADGERAARTTATVESTTTTAAPAEVTTSTTDPCAVKVQDAIAVIGIQLDGLQAQPAIGLPPDDFDRMWGQVATDVGATCGVARLGEAMSAILVYLSNTSAVRPEEATGAFISEIASSICDEAGDARFDVELTAEAQAFCTGS